MAPDDVDAVGLRAEDGRLTPGQAERIARALRERAVSAASGTGALAAGGSLGNRRLTLSSDVLAQLRAAIESDLDPVSLMRRVLEQSVALLPLAEGASIDFAIDGLSALRCAAAAGILAGREGTAAGLDPATTGLALTSGGPARSRGARGSTITVPLMGPPGLWAVLTVASNDPDAFTDDDVELLWAMAAFVATAFAGAIHLADAARAALDGGHPAAAVATFVAGTVAPSVEVHLTRAVAAERIRSVIAGRGFAMVFQPIAALDDGRVVGFEALARFDGEPARPEMWFREAADAGLGVELELAAVRAALGALDRLPPSSYLSVNVSPSTAVSSGFAELCDGFVQRLVIEVTEHAPVDDYEGLTRALHRLREGGARLAIDDAGAGFASLRHVLRLSPDVIKLDVSLTRHIDTDPVRRALASSLIAFADELGTTIVAEGIETRWEKEALASLGVRFGQGFHLARPEPLGMVPLERVHA